MSPLFGQLDVHEEDYVWLFNVGDGRVILKRISSVLWSTRLLAVPNLACACSSDVVSFAINSIMYKRTVSSKCT